MKTSSLLRGFNPDLENRKRLQQRKDVGEVYKKHAKYADVNKNPMLKALENLLSGKTEKELHEADVSKRKDSQQTGTAIEELLERPEIKKEINQLKQTEQEVITHENAHKAAGVTGAVTYTHMTGPDDQRYINGGEVAIQMPTATDDPDETIALLEKVRQAALAPAEPSPQDLRVAANVSAQIQQARADKSSEQVEQEETKEVAPFANEDLSFEVPEKFQKDFARNPDEQTVFGQDLEKLLFQRTFTSATQKYSSHIAMVNNGYRSADEPVFSEVA